MIIGQQKSIAEIKEKLAPFSRVLVLGCGTCVKTCFAGGEDEVATLAAALRLAFRKDGKNIIIDELTIERQCEDEFIKEAATAIARNGAVLTCPPEISPPLYPSSGFPPEFTPYYDTGQE
jgi:hypothetical protein